MDKNTTKVLFCYMFSLFCEKQENCKAISGHFYYVNHKYTTSRRKHIWHLENIRNTKKQEMKTLKGNILKEKNQNLRKNILLLLVPKNAANIFFLMIDVFLNKKFLLLSYGHCHFFIR